jgi:hypothetical protein
MQGEVGRRVREELGCGKNGREKGWQLKIVVPQLQRKVVDTGCTLTLPQKMPRLAKYKNTSEPNVSLVRKWSIAFEVSGANCRPVKNLTVSVEGMGFLFRCRKVPGSIISSTTSS